MRRNNSAKSHMRNLVIVVLVLGIALTSGFLFAKSKSNPGPTARVHLLVFKGQPVSSTLGAADEVYTNCYYGDEGDGPTGVASLDQGEECAEGTSVICTGTISACDAAVGFGQ